MIRNTTLEKVLSLQELLINHATGREAEIEKYPTLRLELMQDPNIRLLLPSFLIECRDLNQFWHYIKGSFGHYSERREFIWGEFKPLLIKLEQEEIEGRTPTSKAITETLTILDAEHVTGLWSKVLERRIQDPEGAITAAKALLESVCKTILEDLGKSVNDDWDLPKLYKNTAEQLNLAPSQHTEQIFKQILGGCQSVVDGLGALRNKLGDAHGKGKKPIKPAARHAELAANLSGSMAIFLIRTWENNKQGSDTPKTEKI
jgi:hypothetical protein